MDDLDNYCYFVLSHRKLWLSVFGSDREFSVRLLRFSVRYRVFLGSMLPQYMALCVSFVSSVKKKFKVQYLLNGSSDLYEI